MLKPSWVGRRVSVRRVVERRPDGRLLQSDVVGDLVGLDAQTAVIESRTGLVELPVALVTIAKLVPASTADELTLERIAAAGLRPAETGTIGGWTLRADHGFTGRANSALPLGQLGLPLDEILGRASDWYAERGLPLRLHLPVEARRLLDAELGERGWEPSIDSTVLVRRLGPTEPTVDQDATTSSDEPTVTLSAVPDDDWQALYRGGAGLVPTARALLVRHDRVTFAAVRIDGRTVATARGVVDDGWLGVMAVEVDPAYRRHGLAGAVMRALSAWAVGQGARRAYLQVQTDNTAALRLYDRLGYWPHHDYRYRTEPVG